MDAPKPPRKDLLYAIIALVVLSLLGVIGVVVFLVVKRKNNSDS